MNDIKNLEDDAGIPGMKYLAEIGKLVGTAIGANIETQVEKGASKAIVDGAKNVKPQTLDIANKMDIDADGVAEKTANAVSDSIDNGIKEVNGNKKTTVDINAEIDDEKLKHAIKKEEKKINNLIDKLYDSVGNRKINVDGSMKLLTVSQAQGFAKTFGKLGKLLNEAGKSISEKYKNIADNILEYTNTSDSDIGFKTFLKSGEQSAESFIESIKVVRNTIDDTAKATKELTNETNKYNDALSKNFKTSGKKAATDQLRSSYKEFMKYHGENGIDVGKITRDMSDEGRIAGYNYTQAFIEAINQGVAQSTLEKYSAREWGVKPGETPDDIRYMMGHFQDFLELQNKVMQELGNPELSDNAKKAFKDYLDQLDLIKARYSEEDIANGLFDKTAYEADLEILKLYKEELLEVLKLKKQSQENNASNLYNDAIKEYIEDLEKAETKTKETQKAIQEGIRISSENDEAGSSLELLANLQNEIAENAKKATSNIKEEVDALEKLWIRSQKGSGNSSAIVAAFSEFENRHTTRKLDSDGNIQETTSWDINYDKLKDAILKKDREILELERQIKNAEDGTAEGAKENLQMLKAKRQAYEDILDAAIQSDKYAINDNQRDILTALRAEQEQKIRNQNIDKDVTAAIIENKKRSEEETKKQIQLEKDWADAIKENIKWDRERQNEIQKRGKIEDAAYKENEQRDFNQELTGEKNITRSKKLEQLENSLKGVDNLTQQFAKDFMNLEEELSSAGTNENALKKYDEHFKQLTIDVNAAKQAANALKKEQDKLDAKNKRSQDKIDNANLKESNNLYKEIRNNLETISKLELQNQRFDVGLKEDTNNQRVINEQEISRLREENILKAQKIASLDAEDAQEEQKILDTLSKINREAEQATYKNKSEILSDISKRADLLDQLATKDKYLASADKLNKAADEMREFVRETDIANVSLDELAAKNKEFINSTQAYSDAAKGLKKFEEINSKLASISSKGLNGEGNDLIKKFQNQLAQIDVTAEEDRRALQELEAQIKQTFDGTALKNFQLASDNTVSQLRRQMQEFLSSNTNLGPEFKARGESIITQLSAEPTIAEANKLKAAIADIRAEATRANQTGKSFLDTIREKLTGVNAQLIAQYLSWQDLIRYFRTAADQVIQIDSAITELRKVSNASTARLSESFAQSAKTAKELGSSITEVINQTADWSRLGFPVDQAEDLARVTTLFQTVGDNMTAETASEYLISTLEGFELGVDKAESIIDRFNEVANNYAIDTAGIGEALQRSAASFNLANTDLSESIAIVTAANTVIQDPARVGGHFAYYKSSYIG